MKNKIIILKEYQVTHLEKHELSESIAQLIYRNFRSQVSIESPSFKNQYRWQLTPYGWVGLIPINSEVTINIHPKIPIKNLFAMWEYAYNLKSFHILDGMVQSETIEDYYNQLVYVLVQKVNNRLGRGIYKSFETTEEKLSYITGRLIIDDMVKKPWEVNKTCQYNNLIMNNIHNQILLWTFYILLKSKNLKESLVPIVKKIYKSLEGFVQLVPISNKDIVEQHYNNLNSDYKLLHAICRFFIENKGPQYNQGNYTTIPFIVNMGRLFESFVAEWLEINLPPKLSLRKQENFSIGEERQFIFNIDLVIYDNFTGDVKCVIDTKYKDPSRINQNDINQIITYAVSKRCDKGILLYPKGTETIGCYKVEGIEIYTMAFDIIDDIEKGGELFLGELLKVI